ncbi:bacitracin ABC transporter ATP-binding protein [Bacillus sp. DJP31]
MFKQSRPLLDDEFLDELAKEINDLYGDTAKESKDPTLEIE